MSIHCDLRSRAEVDRLEGRPKTVVTSLRSQNRNVLEFMIEAIRTSRRGSTSPSLLLKESSSADSMSLAA